MAIYRRIVLKLSGETLSSRSGGGCYDEQRVGQTAEMALKLRREGVELAIVLGGGNIWRGRFSKEMDAVSADQIGMLATVMNALALADAISRRGGRAVVFTAQEMNRFAQLYTRDAALEVLRSGGIALLAGGIGNPFFTTDTASALRAAELGADALLKGTTEQGVLDDDPRVNPNAQLIPEATYTEVLRRRLKVMDATAFELCHQQRVPVLHVFSMEDLDNVVRVVNGQRIGSIIRQ